LVVLVLSNSPWCRDISKNVQNETTKLISVGNTFGIIFYSNDANYFTSDFMYLLRDDMN